MPGAVNMFLAASGPAIGSLDPSNKGGDITLSNGNRSATNTAPSIGNWETVRSTANYSTGKYYFEVINTSGVHSDTGYLVVGVANSSFPFTTGTWVGSTSTASAYFDDGSGYYYNGSRVATDSINFANNSTTPHTVCVCVDVGSRLIWAALPGGIWNDSGTANPASGVGGFTISVTGNLYAAISMAGGNQMSLTINLGQTAFAGTVPTGFTAWG